MNDNSIKEMWKDIPGWEGYYQVSTMGRVKSLARVVFHRRLGKFSVGERILSPGLVKGYEFVGFYRNGRAKNYRVNRLVAIAFIPNPLNLPEVNHLDLNKRNNKVGNLEWITTLGNAKHSIKNGPKRKKPKGRPKISTIQVKEIRRLWKTGEYVQREIAQLFGLKSNTISYIVNRLRWKEIL